MVAGLLLRRCGRPTRTTRRCHPLPFPLLRPSHGHWHRTGSISTLTLTTITAPIHILFQASSYQSPHPSSTSSPVWLALTCLAFPHYHIIPSHRPGSLTTATATDFWSSYPLTMDPFGQSPLSPSDFFNGLDIAPPPPSQAHPPHNPHPQPILPGPRNYKSRKYRPCDFCRARQVGTYLVHRI